MYGLFYEITYQVLLRKTSPSTINEQKGKIYQLTTCNI